MSVEKPGLLEFSFDSREQFIEKLRELVQRDVSAESITVWTPFHVDEAVELLKPKPSPLRFIALFGALTGFFLSFAYMIYTVLDWPLIVGGKPLIAVPAFIIVSFESTILIGGVVSFLGFLILVRLPHVGRIIHPVDYGNRFVIRVRHDLVSQAGQELKKE